MRLFLPKGFGVIRPVGSRTKASVRHRTPRPRKLAHQRLNPSISRTGTSHDVMPAEIPKTVRTEKCKRTRQIRAAPRAAMPSAEGSTSTERQANGMG